MNDPVLILGAGPAGLTAAYELARHGRRVDVVEQASQVGGISRTEVRNGFRFDIGGHRFFSKNDEVNDLWKEVLGEEFLRVPRLSRIFFGGQFYDYPLRAYDTLRKLGAFESVAILLSYLKAKISPYRYVKTFEQWVVNRFGRRLFNTFFKTYTEKVWGISCSELSADWAAQRIKGLSLRAAVTNAMFGGGAAKSLIKEFDYPRFGPGQMWESFARAIESRGNTVTLGAESGRICHDGKGRVTGVDVKTGGGVERRRASHVINSTPLPLLVHQLEPPAPPEVLAAADALKHRDFLIVGLVVRRDELFPDNWIYIHTPGVKVGRIQNFKNWSKSMLPDPAKTSLGLEYFCTRGDAVWESTDADLIALAKRELAQLNLAKSEEIEGGVVIRQPMAYPVYDDAYKSHTDVIRAYLATFTNLQTVGRNGMHRYNNQDHSMLTGLYAARNVLGGKHDLWEINADESYHETRDDGKPNPTAKYGADAAVAVPAVVMAPAQAATHG